VTVSVFVGLTAVILSPLALGILEGLTRSSWTTLSQIGETYGGAAAILTAATLGGIIASLVLQVRESKIAREQATRSMHFDLVRITMDEPRLLAAVGLSPQTGPDDLEELRERQLANLWLTYWHTIYDLDYLPTAGLRIYLNEFFRGDSARTFWADVGSTWPHQWHGRRHRRFCQIVNEEHRAALAMNPLPRPVPVGTSKKVQHNGTERAFVFTAGLAVGTMFTILLTRLLRRRAR
jgi:hypothetical protein